MQFLDRIPFLNIFSHFPKFIFIGILNTLIGYSIIFSLLYLVGINYILSNAVGYIVGLCVSFYLNKYYNFKTASRKTIEFFMFCASFLVSFAINNITLILLIECFSLPKYISIIIAGCIYTSIFYLLSRIYVFKSTTNPNQ